MAKRRSSYKRDRLGRFAGGVLSLKIKYHNSRARQITKATKLSIAAENSYIKDTGDVGSKKDVARFNAQIARGASKAAQHRAKAVSLRGKRRR